MIIIAIVLERLSIVTVHQAVPLEKEAPVTTAMILLKTISMMPTVIVQVRLLTVKECLGVQADLEATATMETLTPKAMYTTPIAIVVDKRSIAKV
jgi:hypothetical protein